MIKIIATIPRALWMRGCHKYFAGASALLVLAVAGVCGAAQNKHVVALSPKLQNELASAEAGFNSQINPTYFSLGIFMEAADHGSAAGMRDVGLVNLDRDNELALSWFERAAVAGDARANSYVGDFYLNAANGRPDPKTARYWYEKAYVLKDSRGTMELAEMSCKGNGVPVNHAECERELADSTKYFKSSDPKETRLRLQTACMEIGDRYKKGTGTPVKLVNAATWYDRAAVLGLPAGAIAETRLYVEKGGLPLNLVRAEAILDASVAFHNEVNNDAIFVNREGSFGFAKIMDGQNEVATLYIEIGQKYEARGQQSMLKAIPIYLKAAKLGDGSGSVKLGLRYLNGTGVPVNLDMAYKVLMGITNLAIFSSRMALADALDKLADAYSVPKLKDANATRIKELRETAAKERELPTLVAALTPEAATETQMVARYPNLLAPDSVPVEQEFAVNVSLNSIAFDANTQILSGQQKDGQLQIALPLGMTTMPIQVDLIAPGMTFVDGSNSGTIELDATRPESTPAVFHLRSGSKPADGVLLATLSYHQNFIAQLERKISIVAVPESAPSPAGANVPTTTNVPNVSQPAPVVTAEARSDNSHALQQGAAHPASINASQSRPATLNAGAPAQRPVTPPIVLDPTAKTTDLTITETLVGDTMHYAFDSPGLSGTVYADVPNAAATKLNIEEAYAQLEGQSKILSHGSGAACAAARQKGAGGDKDPNCADSVNARNLMEGIGNDLFDNKAPQAFRDIYQLLSTNHIRLHTIHIVTNSPTLPWELMRPKSAEGSREFLGLTASIVRENMAAPQLAQPANVQMESIAYIAPTYSGEDALASSATEVHALKSFFPMAKAVPGDSTDVSAFVKNAPQGIIHFTGHGQRIAQSDLATTPSAAANQLAPQVAIKLEDMSMTPATFAAIRGDGKPAHPFYFFNACDLGRSDQQLNYVDGWASTLMQSGASGYIGALYQVGDASAASFSTHFYSGLKANLAGDANWTMADLVTQARKQTYAESDDPSALAYVLYTKPFMKLVAGN